MNWSYQKKKEHSSLNKLWNVLAALGRLKLRTLTEPELLEKWELWTALLGGDGNPPVTRVWEFRGVDFAQLRPVAVMGLERMLNSRYSALEDKENNNAKQERTNQELIEKNHSPVFCRFFNAAAWYFVIKLFYTVQ